MREDDARRFAAAMDDALNHPDEREPLDVDVIGWSTRDAVALVDGVRVRIRRGRQSVRWTCDACGVGDEPHCEHTRALAATPALPEKRSARAEPRRRPRGPGGGIRPDTPPPLVR